jgi:hypothetical protein
MDGGGRFPIHHLLYFARINGYAFTGNSVAQKFYTIQPEFTLGKLSIELMVSKMLANNVQVLSMIFLVLGINKDVINKNHNELVKFKHEYRIHEIHEVGRSICEPERHDQILI